MNNLIFSPVPGAHLMTELIKSPLFEENKWYTSNLINNLTFNIKDYLDSNLILEENNKYV